MTILKQLIEQMIGDYLNESYEDDLVESIFEEVSEETWEAIEEAILNELSPKTLASYVKKASKDAASKSGKSEYEAGRAHDKIYHQKQPDHSSANFWANRSQKTSEKADKRLKGITKAVDRLTK
jgi:hypothetical protein